MLQTATDHADIVSIPTSSSTSVEVMRTWYRTQVFPRHTHPYFTLGLMLRGVGTLWSGGVTRTLTRGDIIVISPADVHTGGLGHGDEVLSYVALHVPPELMSVAAESLGLSSRSIETLGSFVLRDRRIAAELRRVDHALATELDLPAADAAITTAIDLLVRGQCAPSGSHDISASRDEPAFVRVARSAIEDCYGDNDRVALKALAALAGVSPFYLVREFTRVIGLSPHRYVMQTRVRRAGELLASGMPLSDVAATVGFVDQSHLTTCFRRYVGTTPASYQRGVARSSA